MFEYLSRDATVGENLGLDARDLSSCKLVHARIISVVHEVV